MVDDDGSFEIELVSDGIPGVVRPTTMLVKGHLTPAALTYFRRLERNVSPAKLAVKFKQAVERRRQRGALHGPIAVTTTDLKPYRLR